MMRGILSCANNLGWKSKISIILLLLAGFLCFGLQERPAASRKELAKVFLTKYEDVIQEYVTRTRQWKKEEYYIRFNYIDEKKHEADFTIVNIEDKKIFRSKIPPEKRRPNYQSCQWYPLEFYATIDTRQGKIVQELWLRKKEFLPLHPEFNIPGQ